MKNVSAALRLVINIEKSLRLALDRHLRNEFSQKLIDQIRSFVTQMLRMQLFTGYAHLEKRRLKPLGDFLHNIKFVIVHRFQLGDKIRQVHWLSNEHGDWNVGLEFVLVRSDRWVDLVQPDVVKRKHNWHGRIAL